MITEKSWFSQILRPSRYIDHEINIVKKDPEKVEVSIALAFPDVYEVGMSHLGLKILYHILNKESWIYAERVFCPWVDLEKRLRKEKIPLWSLESKRPLSEFDIIGFSLQHELCYTNILTMLSLCDIPFFSDERGDEHPFIIAGGPVCFNPEPVARFFDLIVIGDGEEVLLKICKVIREAKASGINKKESILKALAQVEGIYIPSLKQDKVKKAIVKDIDQYPFPDSQVVPFTEIVHDRLSIEIFRGCGRGCRFCQAGFIYRPIRERSPESVLEKAIMGLKKTGYEEISLLSLSSGDYSCIDVLIERLMDIVEDKKIALSLPSLRIDSMNPVIVEQIKRVRKTGFTLAPEAGNEDLRRVINKNISDEEILRISELVYKAGWNLIKLYFMVGLPTEQTKHVADIAKLSKEVLKCAGKRAKKNKLNISIATFVPKSHTPFMWEEQLSVEEAKERIFSVRDALKGSAIRVKWNDPELSWLEGIFSRGDRRLSDVIVSAWNMGARFDSWSEHFNKQIWERAFHENGVDPSEYLRGRSPDESLPWDHIDSGVKKDFLLAELKKAFKGELTEDCRKKCNNCGVCDKEIRLVLCKDLFVNRIEIEKRREEHKPIKRYRMIYTKIDIAKFLSQLEVMRAIARAFRRSDIDLVYSQGFHPMPKISFSHALPVGVESVHEVMDVQIRGELDCTDAKSRINRELPKGIRILSVYEIPKKSRIFPKESHYLVVVKDGFIRESLLKNFDEQDKFCVKKGDKEIDLKKIIKSISFEPDGRLNIIVRHGFGEVRILDIVKEIFGVEDKDILKIIRMRQVI